MRASSPALALLRQTRGAVPRPRPRVVKADKGDPANDTSAAAPTGVPRSPSAPTLVTEPSPELIATSRPTLHSVDLEEMEPPRRSTVPPPLPARARVRRRERLLRLSRPEIGETVLAALRDLAFFETPVEAAAFGLVTALRALPAMAGLVLLADERRGGWTVVYARGPRSHTVVRAHVPGDDPVAGLAMVRAGPVAVEYGPELVPPERHASFGDPWSALVAPVLVDERCVALVELVDPLDGRALGDSARDALTTIAQHLSVFLAGREELHAGRAFAPEQVGLEQ